MPLESFRLSYEKFDCSLDELEGLMECLFESLSCIQSHFWETEFIQKWLTTLKIQIKLIYAYE